MHEKLVMVFIKTFFMNICLVFSFVKIKGGKKITKRNTIQLFFINIIVCILYIIIYKNTNVHLRPVFTNLICYSIYLLIFSMLIDEIDRSLLIVVLMSMPFTFAAFFLSSTILYVITSIQLFKSIRNSIIEYWLVGNIQMVVIYYFFKIKRFKDGFSFIKEDKFYKNTNKNFIILSIVILTFIVFVHSTGALMNNITFSAIVFAMIFTIYLIKKYITNHYKSKMKDRTVEMLNEQIEAKDKIIEDLKEELSTVLNINHKYNHRISAAEKAVAKLKFNEEFASENTEIIDLVNNLSKNYKNELLKIEKRDDDLPKTEVFGIDNMLEYMSNEAKKNNISFEVEVKCNVKDIVDNIVNQSKLETLLADHINDAMIAIKYSSNTSHKIKIVFDKIDDINEIKIYDTGIEFEIDTLIKLGQEQITTHKDNGGSGIGFMTTFETLRECKGSLIIEEYNQEPENYTKAIIIKFDNKNEYRISSYRAETIKEQNIENRVSVENLF